MVGEVELGLVAARDDGMFYIVMLDGIKLCDALTHSYTEPDGSYVSKTPNGIYLARKGMHRLQHGGPFETFEIMGIYGHTGILFHKGNYEQDSTGCFLLGTRVGSAEWSVINSAHAFQQFMGALHEQDTVTVRVSDD